MIPVTGGCLCGAVRYEAASRGSHPTLCHCTSCRRASGAPAVAWVTFPRRKFRITDSPRDHHSSTGITRTFCPECGSSISYAREDLPDEIDVTIATLDHPDEMPPADHTWWEEHLSWLERTGSLPRFKRARDSG